MKITQAIILAGGEGTRLQQAVPGLPKCLAPVKGRAFIDYLVAELLLQGMNKFVFALGIKATQVKAHLDEQWPGLDKQYAIETVPLGTGGAIKNAASYITERNVLIANGDTLFKIDLPAATNFHEVSGATCTILLKPLRSFERYGTVEINDQKRVTAFREKYPVASGLINGGVYLLDVREWKPANWPETFSFEQHYLQQQFDTAAIYGFVQDQFFIDIGVPEDYEKAQTVLPGVFIN